MNPLRRIFNRVVTRPVRTLSSVSAYALWAENYPPHAHNLLMQTEEATMQEMMPIFAGKCVLDLACGSGRYSQLALSGGADTVIGIDNSFEMLQVGRDALKTKEDTCPHFLLGTTEVIPLSSQSIDVVLCGLALGHLPRLTPSLAEISRVLKSDGIALVSDFHPFLFLDGKQRTFSAGNGAVYAVEHYAHLYSDYLQSAQTSGLNIDLVKEPQLTIDGAQIPAVIVYRLRKT